MRPNLYRGQPRAYAPPGALQPRAAAAAHGATATRLRARLRLSRPPAQRARTGAGGARRARARRARRRAGGARRRRLPGDRAGAESRDAAARRHLLEGRRGRQLPRVHTPARKEAERVGARFRFNAHVETIRAGAGPGLRVLQAPHDARDEALRARDAEASGWSDHPARAGRDERTELRRDRRLRRGRIARLAAPARPPYPAGRGPRLFGDCAAAQRRRSPAPRAARGADGRALQGRDQPPRPARPRRRQRRNRRRPEHHSERAQATLDKVLDDWFPGVPRRSAGAALEGRAADAPRRPARARGERRRGRLAQRRPWRQRLGACLRVGAARRRRDRRPQGADRHRRARHREVAPHERHRLRIEPPAHRARRAASTSPRRGPSSRRRSPPSRRSR